MLEKRNWFVAKLVFAINTQSNESQPQFDEQWRMVLAADMVEAHAKALELGNQCSDSMSRFDGTQLHWEFISITDIFSFTLESNGDELFSRITVPDNPEVYLHTLKLKSDHVADVISTSNLQMAN